eukprot:TRINITY_DN6020_c0_g1_i2.p1 TRINITY_DN6020_c0_g1~~TRINITY_DN6020_c0_g1_i2.p1  ORF type:complete len:782 (+),score=186.23 TRINITY_DN6020_c0_g1_i2:74-2419(+)
MKRSELDPTPNMPQNDEIEAKHPRRGAEGNWVNNPSIGIPRISEMGVVFPPSMEGSTTIPAIDSNFGSHHSTNPQVTLPSIHTVVPRDVHPIQPNQNNSMDNSMPPPISHPSVPKPSWTNPHPAGPQLNPMQPHPNHPSLFQPHMNPQMNPHLGHNNPHIPHPNQAHGPHGLPHGLHPHPVQHPIAHPPMHPIQHPTQHPSQHSNSHPPQHPTQHPAPHSISHPISHPNENSGPHARSHPNIQSHPPTTRAPEPAPPQTQAELNTEPQKHAMDFLYKVRIQYSSTPSVYNQFLEIMKEFKSSSIDTPEVITRVKDLFRGNDYLIQEFNLFLPPGYRIEPDPEPVQPPPSLPSIVHPHPAQNISAPPPLTAGHHVGTALPNTVAMHPPAVPAPAAGIPGQSQADLNHARTYVRKIKTRFSHQPSIYKKFLEILQAYYQQQHSIAEVLEAVADLFSSHPDLLDEFRQFLPKAIGDSSLQLPPTAGPKKVPKPRQPKKPEREKKPAREKSMKMERERESEKEEKMEEVFRDETMMRKTRAATEREKPKSANHGLEMLSEGEVRRKPSRKEVAEEAPRPKRVHHPEDNIVQTNLEFLHIIRKKLNSEWLYHNFLSLIELWSEETITKQELLPLVKKCMADHPALYTRFKDFVAYDGPNDGFPSEEALLIKEEGNAVENNGVNAEDEDLQEFEVMIQLNASTMRAFEELMECTDNSSCKSAVEALDALHLRTVERMYDERGIEVLEALSANPMGVVPVILKRLRQRNQDWHKLKMDNQVATVPLSS